MEREVVELMKAVCEIYDILAESVVDEQIDAKSFRNLKDLTESFRSTIEAFDDVQKERD